MKTEQVVTAASTVELVRGEQAFMDGKGAANTRTTKIKSKCNACCAWGMAEAWSAVRVSCTLRPLRHALHFPARFRRFAWIEKRIFVQGVYSVKRCCSRSVFCALSSAVACSRPAHICSGFEVVPFGVLSLLRAFPGRAKLHFASHGPSNSHGPRCAAYRRGEGAAVGFGYRFSGLWSK